MEDKDLFSGKPALKSVKRGMYKVSTDLRGESLCKYTNYIRCVEIEEKGLKINKVLGMYVLYAWPLTNITPIVYTQDNTHTHPSPPPL